MSIDLITCSSSSEDSSSLNSMITSLPSSSIWVLVFFFLGFGGSGGSCHIMGCQQREPSNGVGVKSTKKINKHIKKQPKVHQLTMQHIGQPDIGQRILEDYRVHGQGHALVVLRLRLGLTLWRRHRLRYAHHYGLLLAGLKHARGIILFHAVHIA